MYDIEHYYQAEDITDAIRALEADKSAELISGGSDVLIQIREGRLSGRSLVSIHGIKELSGIHLEEDQTIVIGAATVFSHITNHPLIKDRIPILGNAVDQIGGPQIRNMGTIGGNVCNGVTSADSASSLYVLNAVMVLEGSGGKREVPISEWYTGPGKTVREHGEILREIRISSENYENFGGHYIKYGKRNAMEIATLGCAVNVRLDTSKQKIEDMRIAFGVAAPVPIRCRETEAEIRGQMICPLLYETVGKSVLKEVNPRSSWRASREFRIQLVEELSKRAMKQAVHNAGGEADA